MPDGKVLKRALDGCEQAPSSRSVTTLPTCRSADRTREPRTVTGPKRSNGRPGRSLGSCPGIDQETAYGWTALPQRGRSLGSCPGIDHVGGATHSQQGWPPHCPQRRPTPSGITRRDGARGITRKGCGPQDHPHGRQAARPPPGTAGAKSPPEAGRRPPEAGSRKREAENAPPQPPGSGPSRPGHRGHCSLKSSGVTSSRKARN